MTTPPNPEAILSFILAFSVVSFGFVFYHAITTCSFYKQWESQSKNNTIQIVINRLLGILFFGFSSVVLISFTLHADFSFYGAGLPNLKTFKWLLILSAIMIPMNFLNARDAKNLAQYPQIRLAEWSYSLIILSAASWIAYLFAYEFLFRGFFLFASIPVLGIWPSIILNTAVYSLVHIPKGNKETLGAIPFGILISYLTIETGSFWIAFFAHIVLALSNEWFSLAAQPEMSVKKNKT